MSTCFTSKPKRLHVKQTKQEQKKFPLLTYDCFHTFTPITKAMVYVCFELGFQMKYLYYSICKE